MIRRKHKVKCEKKKCGYSWKTTSVKKFVSCPNCLNKVRNKQ